MLSRRRVLAGSALLLTLGSCKKDPPGAGAASPAPRPDPQRIKRVLERLGPWRKKHQRTAWVPVLADSVSETELTGSRMGGTPWLAAAEEWPTCGSCKQPLQLFLQLQTSTMPHEVAGRYGAGLIQLFYCVSDRWFPTPSAQAPAPKGSCAAADYEAFSPAHLVRLVPPGAQGKRGHAPSGLVPFPSRTITGWKAIADGPESGEHEALGLETEFDSQGKTVRVTVSELGLDEAGLPSNFPEQIKPTCHDGDKLAGWPRWVQSPEYPKCPKCSELMQPVFQVDSDHGVPFTFGDMGIGHVTQCAEHKDVLAFAWACS